LFEAPLEEFVAARDALARELRKAGDGENAARVAALRKPTKAVWLVNQLVRRAPGELRKLVDATGRIRAAQEKGSPGDEVRAAMREQREALGALVAAAGDPALERRIHDTLQTAALADPAALLEGRIDRELVPTGFEALSGVQLSPASSAAPHRAARADEAAPKDDGKKARRELQAAEKEAAKMSALATKAEQAAEKAAAAAKDARERAHAAEARARQLRERK
jgi:hypothetical protein